MTGVIPPDWMTSRTYLKGRFYTERLQDRKTMRKHFNPIREENYFQHKNTNTFLWHSINLPPSLCTNLFNEEIKVEKSK